MLPTSLDCNRDQEKTLATKHMAWGLAQNVQITVPNIFIAIISATTTSEEHLVLFLLVGKPRRVRINPTHSCNLLFGASAECKYP